MKAEVTLIVFLMSISVYGADICPECQPELVVDDVSGGLNTKDPPYKMDHSFSPNLKNVFIDSGRIKTVNGYTVVGGTSSLRFVTGIFPYIQEDGSAKFIVTDSSVVLETSDFNTYATVGTGFNPGILMRCIQVRNKMWCSNGSDPVFTWDSSTRVALNGTVGTPNVPKFKYMAYWGNRVFGVNTVADGSSMDWSALSSTNGTQIAPDNFLAWPAANNLSISRGDGQTSNGIWVQNGQLRLCKDFSLFTIFAIGSSFFDRKDDSQVGCISNDAITVLDGYSYVFGNDAIYEDKRRTTDKISDDIGTVQKAVVKTLETVWDTQSEFSKGNLNYGSTVTASGLVTIRGGDDILANVVQTTEPNTATKLTITDVAPIGYIGTLESTQTIPPGINSYPSGFDFWGRCTGANCPMEIVIANVRTSSDTRMRVTVPVTSNFIRVASTFAVDPTGPIQAAFLASDIPANLNITIQRYVGFVGGQTFEFYTATHAGKSSLSLRPATTIQFISDVSTLNSVTAWDTLESIRNTNGGTIDFFVRTSTSSVNISTQIWVPQTPGARISAPTINNYVQWASTISSPSTSPATASNIDKVTIGHVEGAGAVNRPFSLAWDNRLWVSVATETSGNFSRILVKSLITNKNRDAWMPIEGINIRSFAKDGASTLYGGSASSGTFYRLDYGTNFNGQAIDALYDTPEVFFDSPYKEKTLFDFHLFAERQSGNVLTLGSSFNGSDFTNRSIDLDGTGRTIKIIQSPTNPKAHYFKWRFRNNQLDKQLNVTNFGVMYQPTQVAKPK